MFSPANVDEIRTFCDIHFRVSFKETVEDFWVPSPTPFPSPCTEVIAV